MFFFIAGIQPKHIDLEDQPRLCPSCGLYQARLRRVDHYFSVFFLPVFRVKKGDVYLECTSCGNLSKETQGGLSSYPEQSVKTCPNCGKHLEISYRFCPYCGKRV